MLKNYFGETREGFYIRPMMQRVWAVQLDILRQVDRICRAHHIPWYADWGTLLGAVRHGGYIPWDDDIDISMRRMDFERFKRYAPKELPEGYACRMDRDAEMSDLVFRISNSQEVRTDDDFLRANHGCPYIVGIDIFVYDNIPDEQAERETYISVFTYTFAAAADPTPDMLFDDCTEESRDLIRKAERMTGVTLDRAKPVKAPLIALADRVAAMYFDVETRDIAQACYLPHNSRYAFRKEWFDDIVYLPFEGMEIPAPAGYDDVLRGWYGDDYMEPKRYSNHQYPYFKAQEEALHAGAGNGYPNGFSMS